jgi:hypothetical protein
MEIPGENRIVWKIAAGVLLALVSYGLLERFWAAYELRQWQAQLAADWQRVVKEGEAASIRERQAVAHAQAEAQSRRVAIEASHVAAHEALRLRPGQSCFSGTVVVYDAVTRSAVQLLVDGRPVKCSGQYRAQ